MNSVISGIDLQSAYVDIEVKANENKKDNQQKKLW